MFPMKSRREDGLTVIELVTTLTLIGIALGLSTMGIRNVLAREEANDWARTVVHELTAAQQAAVTRRVIDPGVTVSFQNRIYTVVIPGGGVLRQETLPAHLTFGSTLQTVTFDRRGTPGGVSSIVLSSTTGGRTYTISIEPGTGRASLQ